MPLSKRELTLVLKAKNEMNRGLKGATSSIQNLGDRSEKLADSLNRAGKMLTGLGVKLIAKSATMTAAMGALAFETADFNRELTIAQTQIDDTRISMEFLKDTVRDVGSTIPMDDFQQMPRLMFDLFSTLHPQMEDVETLTRQFAKSAVAGHADIQQVSRTTMNIMNAFQVQHEDVNEVLDAQFRMVQRGTGTYQEFAAALGRTIPAAAATNQTFQTMMGSVAFLTRMGQRTEMAATSTARAMELLARPKVVERLEGMGITVRNNQGEFLQFDQIIKQLSENMAGLTEPEQFARMEELFEGEGFRIQARRFLQMAIQQPQLLERVVDDVSNSAGDMEEAFEQVADTPRAQITRLFNAFTVLRQEMGERFMPILTTTVDALSSAVDWFRNLDEATKDSIARFAMWSAAIAGVAGVLSTIAGLAALAAGAIVRLSASKLALVKSVGMTVVKVNALAAVLITLLVHMEGLREFVVDVVRGILSLDKTLLSLLGTLALFAPKLAPMLGSLRAIQPIAAAVGITLLAVANGLVLVNKQGEEFAGILNTLAVGVGAFLVVLKRKMGLWMNVLDLLIALRGPLLAIVAGLGSLLAVSKLVSGTNEELSKALNQSAIALGTVVFMSIRAHGGLMALAQTTQAARLGTASYASVLGGVLNPKILLVVGGLTLLTKWLAKSGQEAAEQEARIDGYKTALDGLAGTMEEIRNINLDDAFRTDVVDNVQSAVQDTRIDFNELDVSLNTVAEAAMGNGEAMIELTRKYEQAKQEATDAGKKHGLLGVVIERTGGATQSTTESYEELIDIVESTRSEIDQATSAWVENAKAQGGAERAFGRIVELMQRHGVRTIDDLIDSMSSGSREAQQIGAMLGRLALRAEGMAGALGEDAPQAAKDLSAILQGEAVPALGDTAGAAQEVEIELSSMGEAFKEVADEMLSPGAAIETQFESIGSAAEMAGSGIGDMIDQMNEARSEREDAINEARKDVARANEDMLVRDVETLDSPDLEIGDIGLGQLAQGIDDASQKYEGFFEDIQRITGRGAGDVAKMLVEMGDEGIEVAAKLADAGDEHFVRFVNASRRNMDAAALPIEDFADRAAMSAAKWIEGLEDQLDKYREFEENLGEIGAKSSKEVVQAILSMGEQAPLLAGAMVDATDEEFARLTELLGAGAHRTSEEVVDGLSSQLGRLPDIFKGVSEDMISSFFEAVSGGRVRWFGEINSWAELTDTEMRVLAEVSGDVGKNAVDALVTALENGWITWDDDLDEYARILQSKEDIMKEDMGGIGQAIVDELDDQLRGGQDKINQRMSRYRSLVAQGVMPVVSAISDPRTTQAVERFTRGERITGLAAGGEVPGPDVNRDIIPAMLSPGEFVLKRDAVKNLQRLDPQALHTLNEGQLPGFQEGGFATADDVPKPPGMLDLGLKGVVAGGVMRELRDFIGRYVEEFGATQLGSGVGYQAMWDAVSGKFPGINLISGLRPGAITATGNPSYHASGRAIDISPVMDVAEWIRSNYMPETKELIFSPMGNRQIHNGANHVYSGITRDMHWDHIHWAMKNGGIVQQPTKALLGEAGPEKVTPLGTGGQDPVAEEIRGLREDLRNQEPRHIEIHNPTPEPASTSITRELRKRTGNR